MLASVDVEWTKNYKIKNGNRPFCCSVVYLDIPTSRRAEIRNARFEFTSVYLEPGEPASVLVACAETLIQDILGAADIFSGHQVCADLAILANIADASAPYINQARTAWHGRKSGSPSWRVIDTRYDAGHLLTGVSRRLVDVAAELALDVTQPELRGTSMTALHRAWLEEGNVTARERVSVLNLRHSLSTALIALLVADNGSWKGMLNVNQLIAERAAGAWDWLDSSTFRALHAHP